MADDWNNAVSVLFFSGGHRRTAVSVAQPLHPPPCCHFSCHLLPFSFSPYPPAARPPASFQMSIFQFFYCPTYFSQRIVVKHFFLILCPQKKGYMRFFCYIFSILIFLSVVIIMNQHIFVLGTAHTSKKHLIYTSTPHNNTHTHSGEQSCGPHWMVNVPLSARK